MERHVLLSTFCSLFHKAKCFKQKTEQTASILCNHGLSPQPHFHHLISLIFSIRPQSLETLDGTGSQSEWIKGQYFYMLFFFSENALRVECLQRNQWQIEWRKTFCAGYLRRLSIYYGSDFQRWRKQHRIRRKMLSRIAKAQFL